MGKNRPILYNALMLTGVNLLLRFVSTSFQVYLSGQIGAEGIGLLQLVLSVGSLSMTIGMGGIRTATMYLCAEVIGQKKKKAMYWVLSGCVLYSITLSAAVGSLLYWLAPKIAAGWIGNPATTGAIRLLAGFLPVNCLCGVMVGYFTAANRIGTLAAVEIAEQVFSMGATMMLLIFWARSNTEKAVLAVILGSGMGACLTLSALLMLKCRERQVHSARVKVLGKLWQTAVPLAIADNVKAGISTTENLMVPKRLALYPGEETPLASFGMVCGMVFPVLMFPAAILFGLAELLIPELARCNAAGSKLRIEYLTKRSLHLTVIYGAFCGGLLYLLATPLCELLYHTPEAGISLRWYAVLAPMLYCDAITDAITKGMGKQKICVRNNIITSALDVILLFVLLPNYGMVGYFISFTVTHVLNFGLSIHLLRRIVGKSIPVKTALCALVSAGCGVFAAQFFQNTAIICGIFATVFLSVLVLSGIVGRKDIWWIKNLTAA